MANCNSCSAPLPANTNKCPYCGTYNDVDLHSKYDYVVLQQQSDKSCPHCEKPLQTIDVNFNGSFLIERCPACFGFFLEKGQIEILLNKAVADVSAINLQHLDNINKDRYQSTKVKYIKCPVCHVLMNRVNFGQRSGVVVDRCIYNGIWLDCGEITHLMEWKKAGGQLLTEQQKSAGYSNGHNADNRPLQLSNDIALETTMVESIISVISGLFES